MAVLLQHDTLKKLVFFLWKLVGNLCDKKQWGQWFYIIQNTDYKLV